MANQHLMAVFSLLLILSLAFTSEAVNEDLTYEEQTKIDVAVEGMVYCQSCKLKGTWSLVDAKPISSAKVSIICKDQKDRVSFYQVAETDETGYFYQILEGFTMKHYILDHPLHGCTVHLVSSPLPSCKLVTNINYGLDGAALHYNNKRLFGTKYEAVVYTAGPLVFRPGQC